MALSAMITCDSSEIHLMDNVLLNYYFECTTSRYAKNYLNYIRLHLDIDVFALLSNRNLTPEENKELLDNLRFWGNLRFSNSDNTFYRSVSLTNTFGDELFREIWLSHAHVEKLTETVNLDDSSHVIHLELLQKGDKLRYGG